MVADQNFTDESVALRREYANVPSSPVKGPPVFLNKFLKVFDAFAKVLRSIVHSVFRREGT